MASRKIEDLDVVLQYAWTKSYSEFVGTYPTLPTPFLTCTHRDNEEQEILYMMNKNGKDDDGDGKIDEADEWRSNAKAGESKHNLFPSKALDIAFKNKNGKLDWSEDLFKKFADIIKKHGVKWGGDFKKHSDSPHFEID
jgi:peptidoglycan L-alanyl-D-glutamate endopeptidase CwlK